MVTAPIPTVDLRIDLPPPNPVNPPPEDGKRPTIVSLNDNMGDVTYAVDGQPVSSFAEISDKVLERAIENNWAIPVEDIYAEARVFVRADQRTRYGNVVRLMSRLQEDGFVKVGIFAEQAATEG
jgi:biopolymer transport protein ExbD